MNEIDRLYCWLGHMGWDYHTFCDHPHMTVQLLAIAAHVSVATVREWIDEEDAK